uniref:Uncharacterized protein n=1 Tax=Neisseria meningitidis alpha275 TaxID=295996 RepID=C6SJ82_NEIME|nr:hypothetical protein predicted by Glimmer/Critica [Neisseria meningitidis alpha275]
MKPEKYFLRGFCFTGGQKRIFEMIVLRWNKIFAKFLS